MTIDLNALAVQVGQALQRRALMLAVAESCTGGGVAQAITSVSGSSAWFERGFITYSEVAKQEMLGVKPTTLASVGAVSEMTAREMAEGVLRHSNAQVSLAVTGIAGPTGGSVAKPVGLVWFAWSVVSQNTIAKYQQFSGDRQAVRLQAVIFALEELLKIIKNYEISQAGEK